MKNAQNHTYFVFNPQLNEDKVNQLQNEMAKYRDMKTMMPALGLRAKDLLRRSNYPILEVMMKELNIDSLHAKQFKTSLSRFNGTVDDFLKVYERQYSPQINITIDTPVKPAVKPAVKPTIEAVVEPKIKIVAPKFKFAAPKIKIATPKFKISAPKFKKINFAKAKSFCVSVKQQFEMKGKIFRDWIVSHKKSYQVKTFHISLPKFPKKKIAEKTARILAYKESFYQNSKRTLKVAAVTVPFATLCYLGYRQAANPTPLIQIDNITFSKVTPKTSHSVMAQAEAVRSNPDTIKLTPIAPVAEDNRTDTLQITPMFAQASTSAKKQAVPTTDSIKAIHTDTIQVVRQTNVLEQIQQMQASNQSTQQSVSKSKKDKKKQKAQNDVLYNAPNVDLFNQCFVASHAKFDENGHYGITEALYNQFIKENASTAKVYQVSSFRNLDVNDARVIAKAQIYDKYGLAYMTNKSIASALYDAFLMNTHNTEAVNGMVQGVLDYYEVSGRDLTDAQKMAMENIAGGDATNISSSEWRQVISAINATSMDRNGERLMFETMKSQLSNQNIICHYAYEPTLGYPQMVRPMDGFADRMMSANAPTLSTSEYKDALYMEKERDLDAFTKIYMQCAYDNFVKLESGQKKKTFVEANKVLKKYGQKALSSRYYCSGMSIASLCQAADIFSETHPNSSISKAITYILSNCRNVHHCNSLKRDLNLLTHGVIYSKNLERDVQNYMQNNSDALLFAWASRGGNSAHHETFFQASDAASRDAYTYCVYNNQHWGNQETFADYMDSRKQHGRGGYMIDIRKSISDTADKFITQDVIKYEKQLQARASQKKKATQTSNTTNFNVRTLVNWIMQNNT